MRDRCKDAARIALSDMDWYSFSDKSEGCFCLVVGRGLSAAILVGKASSSSETDGEERGTGVSMRTWLARFVYGRFCRGSEAATGVEAFLEAAGVDGAAD